MRDALAALAIWAVVGLAALERDAESWTAGLSWRSWPPKLVAALNCDRLGPA